MTITQILNIQDHPIAYCSDNVKERYVIGLGCVLHKVSNNDPNMRLLFEQWGYSIIGDDVSAWFRADDEASISKAIALHRYGWRFFRLKHQFYFDCFYLTETFDKSLLESAYSVLKNSGSSIFTRSSLENTYHYFMGSNVTLNVGDQLLRHRSDNVDFSNKTEKRMLVVATVSAGKSTIINALTGYYFNQAKNGVCTSHICLIHNKRERDGITFRDKTKFVYNSEIELHSSNIINEAAFHFESTLGTQRICLIDTPGVNNSNDTNHQRITFEAIKANNYDAIIFVSNGQYNGTNDERDLLKILYSETKKPVMFVLNQLDYFRSKTDNIAKMICDYAHELTSIGFHDPRIFPLSAQYALLLRKEEFLDEDEANELQLMRKQFTKPFLDLQHYVGKPSTTELEKSGIIFLENFIKQI